MAKRILRVLCLALVALLIPLGLIAANNAASASSSPAQSADQQQPSANDAAAPAQDNQASTTSPANQSGGTSRIRRFFTPNSDPPNPMPSLWGYPGIWNAIGAGGLPAKSFGESGWVDRINRNPGFLTVTTYGTSGFVSVHRRVALDWQVNIQRKILVRRADQLSLGQQRLASFGFSACPQSFCTPGDLLPIIFFPSNKGNQVMSVLHEPTTGVLLNTAGFYNEYPFAAGRDNTGVGEVVIGGHINLKDFNDEGRGFAVAIHPRVSIPTRYGLTELINSGVQAGGVEVGADLLMEARPGNILDIYINGGYTHAENPEKGGNVVVGNYDYIPAVFGVRLPRNARVQFVAEYRANIFQIGGGTRDAALGSVTDGTGGIQIYFTNWLALSGGYRHTLNHGQYGGDKHGFVATLAASYVPPVYVPIVPPTVTCAATPTTVKPGESINLTATATPSRPEYTLTYTWATTGGRIEGAGPNARLDTTGLAPGTYTVTVRVDDGHGGFADCTSIVTVAAPPPPPPPPAPKPPTVTCAVDRSTVAPGETVMLTATASSPDNRPLNYDWTVTAGRISGSGPTVRWDTTGVPPGTYTATARVTDDRGLSADCSSTVTVSAPPPAPKAARLNSCKFKGNSARVDNVCKAVLDDVALRLQNEPDSRAAVIGSATDREKKLRAGRDLDVRRASDVKAYLVRDKGIAADRIETRTQPDSETVEIWLIPRGANIADVPGTVAPEKMPPERKARPRAAKKPAAKKAPAQ